MIYHNITIYTISMFLFLIIILLGSSCRSDSYLDKIKSCMQNYVRCNCTASRHNEICMSCVSLLEPNCCEHLFPNWDTCVYLEYPPECTFRLFGFRITHCSSHIMDAYKRSPQYGNGKCCKVNWVDVCNSNPMYCN